MGTGEGMNKGNKESDLHERLKTHSSPKTSDPRERPAFSLLFI